MATVDAATALDFLSLPEGKAVELCHDEVENCAWEALDAMALADLQLAPEMCRLGSHGQGIEHLELHGCALVQDVLSPEKCQRLKDRWDFVDRELLRIQNSLEELADPDERKNLEREWLGSVRDRQQRWDLKLPADQPCVEEALVEVASLVELSCLITDPGAPRQNVHVDTGGWKTCCAPLLTTFVALQDVTEDMGPTTVTWQKAHNTNHGSTYSIHHSLAGRGPRLVDILHHGFVVRDVDEARVALEIEAKKKDD
eukprot:Skav215032  [mRNA]  locus=scaffold966:631736:635100:- [translate_table: standard]